MSCAETDGRSSMFVVPKISSHIFEYLNRYSQHSAKSKTHEARTSSSTPAKELPQSVEGLPERLKELTSSSVRRHHLLDMPLLPFLANVFLPNNRREHHAEAPSDEGPGYPVQRET